MRDNITQTRNLFVIETIVTAVFGGVYEYFSHNVYSGFMMFAFAIPLVLGVVPYILLGHVPRVYLPDPILRTVYNSGVITLNVGCVFAGILEIYGTTNRLVYVYPVAAGALFIVSMVAYLFSIVQQSAIGKTSAAQ